MTKAEQWWESHRTPQDFKDGERVSIFVDGIGEVEAKYRTSDGDLVDSENGFSWGPLREWLRDDLPGMNGVIAPDFD